MQVQKCIQFSAHDDTFLELPLSCQKIIKAKKTGNFKLKMNYFINFQMTIMFENLGSGGKGVGRDGRKCAVD